jgi:hypothetical protein
MHVYLQNITGNRNYYQEERSPYWWKQTLFIASVRCIGCRGASHADDAGVVLSSLAQDGRNSFGFQIHNIVDVTYESNLFFLSDRQSITKFRFYREIKVGPKIQAFSQLIRHTVFYSCDPTVLYARLQVSTGPFEAIFQASLPPETRTGPKFVLYRTL